MPQNLDKLGGVAFDRCDSLEEFVIPNSVTYFRECISGCKSLKRLILPENEKCDTLFTIAQNCPRLETVSIPPTVKYIVGIPFAWDYNLKHVDIPASVEYIDPWSFWECRNLTEIMVDENNPVFCAENGMLFSKDKKILHRFPAAEREYKVVIPDGVEEIGEYAFMFCYSLHEITLPASLKRIGSYAFDECFENRGTIRILASEPPELGTDPFWYTGRLDVYVPDDALEAYKKAWPKKTYAEMTFHGINGDSQVSNPETFTPEQYTVYTVQGIPVLNTTDKEELRSLPKGLYIVNGKKVML